MIAPLQMFDVNTLNAGQQMGMQRGVVNSPYTPLGQALDNVLQKYDAHRSAQQQQAYKLEQIKATADRSLNDATALEKYKFELGSPAAKSLSEWNPDPSLPGNQAQVGGVTMYYEPVYDKYGRVIGKKPRNPRALSMMDMLGGSGGTPQTPTADDETEKQLEELTKLQGMQNL